MPVVINELEVVVAPEGDTRGPAAEGSSGPPPLTPPALAELLERRARQELRLYAH